MTYEELSALQYGRSKSFSEAQTDAMAVYCQAEHDLKQLQQENAKLRDEFRKMDEWHSKELSAAIDENVKLRELVRHLYICMERQEPDGSLLCANCPYENESNECDYELRMQELGVEI